jgi:hypothetical protein
VSFELRIYYFLFDGRDRFLAPLAFASISSPIFPVRTSPLRS